jgi:hypothetical protein
MKLMNIFVASLFLAPSFAFARLTDEATISLEQQQVQRNMKELLQSVRGLTPEEVEEAVSPFISDRAPMAYTPAIAAAVIVANAATSHIVELTSEVDENIAPQDEQFDIQL